ncbi:anhydro-N-acetylmuramic acid kinase [Thiobacillus sp.]|uniref:anhydro-N-acetylmuramic acid kinase n=1 Tax=Thiobacillus sp. TaxID=924 RepID=UPI0011D5E845|nr:anhydro-N-acetylmuramic acid kinase [Thiobacillus sp.]TXH73291.1 MAG: anhydro-N-acetylmuramic acid kinase [Thiobacillus sp.]
MSAANTHEAEHYVGLMSGTSLDGVDAVLAEIGPAGQARLLHSHYLPYPDALRTRLLALHTPQPDEIHLAAIAANELAHLYADTVKSLLDGFAADRVRAIGCHGQTLRHRPADGYTLQIGNAALLAEFTGIAVVADFRSRDIAAGGQGAPLVPAFHAQVLRHLDTHRVIANIGGIANITDLPVNGPVRGWDTGPGNMLLDAWIKRHNGVHYDRDGAWATSGSVHPDLLTALMRHAYLPLPPPKSAGREQFNLDWLDARLGSLDEALAPSDVQATLLEFTATSLADAVNRECAGAHELYVCGGGAHNRALMKRISAHLPGIRVATTATLGIDPDWVEALAFAWLARQTLHHAPGNLPAVTGARGERVLGAIYPA